MFAVAVAAPPEPTAELAFGTPTHGVVLGHVDVALRSSRATVDAIVTLALSTDAPAWVETELPIAIPPGASVTALALDTEWSAFVSRSEPIEQARAHFEAAHHVPMDALGRRARPRDPALLEQTVSGLVLHVFPIARDRPTTLRLYLTLPRTASLGVRNGGAAVEILAIPAPPPRDDWMTEDPTRRAAVDTEIALYAGPIVQLPPPAAARDETARHVHRHVSVVPEPDLDRLAWHSTRSRFRGDTGSRP